MLTVLMMEFVLLVMMTTAAVMLIMLMVMVMMLMLVLQRLHVGSQRVLALHRLDQLRTGELRPGSGDQCSLGIMLSDQLHSGVQLCLRYGIRAGQDDGGSGFDLIVVELAKVLHIHLHLTRIGNSHSMTQDHILIGHLFHSGDHVRQLAHAGGLDNDTVRRILADDLGQCLAKIANQTAANAAGVHFRDVDTGILQETAVNTDLTEFIFDQHQLFTGVGFLDHLLDQRGFASAEEAGVNIDLRHINTFCYNFSQYIITPTAGNDKIIFPDIDFSAFGSIIILYRMKGDITYGITRQDQTGKL